MSWTTVKETFDWNLLQLTLIYAFLSEQHELVIVTKHSQSSTKLMTLVKLSGAEGLSQDLIVARIQKRPGSVKIRTDVLIG